MINVILIAAAAFAGGPFKIDGTNIPAADLVTTGAVSFRADSATFNGGRVELGAGRQKALDAKLAGGSGSLVISLVDTTAADTTALTFGAMRLVRKLDGWYLVNTTGGVWRQMDLGTTGKVPALRLAIVESAGQALVYRDGKVMGSTPYDPAASQPLAIGSPSGEKTPWTGELKDLEVLGKALTAADLGKRYSDTVVATGPTTVKPTPTSSSTDTNSAQTKSTVIVATVTDVTNVPEPNDILPYRSAIVTQEYKVVEVKSGHIDKVVPQAIIRVARFGVLAGKKTDVANVKKGDQVELTLEKYSDHPDLEHYYTVDTLPENYAAPYLLDTSKKVSSGG